MYRCCDRQAHRQAAGETPLASHHAFGRVWPDLNNPKTHTLGISGMLHHHTGACSGHAVLTLPQRQGDPTQSGSPCLTSAALSVSLLGDQGDTEKPHISFILCSRDYSGEVSDHNFFVKAVHTVSGYLLFLYLFCLSQLIPLLELVSITFLMNHLNTMN